MDYLFWGNRVRVSRETFSEEGHKEEGSNTVNLALEGTPEGWVKSVKGRDEDEKHISWIE